MQYANKASTKGKTEKEMIEAEGRREGEEGGTGAGGWRG